MAEASKQAVKTCTIGFDVRELDETAYADRVARRFATDHRTRIVSPDDYGLIDTLALHFDEPFADASALPTYRRSEEHTSELQSLMRISYAVFCLKKKKQSTTTPTNYITN